MRTFASIVSTGLLTAALAWAQPTKTSGAEIRVLLNSACASCHRGAQAAGGLSLDSPAGVAKGGRSGSYDDWKLDDLRKRAAEIGIEGRSKMNKADLVEALRDH